MAAASDRRSAAPDPSAVLFADDSPFAVLVLDADPDTGQVTGIYSVTNPDELVRAR